MELIIGEVYEFDYESSSKPSKNEKIKAVMNEELQEKLIDTIRINAERSLANFEAKSDFVLDLVNTKDKTLYEKLKKEFYEVYPRGSKEEKPDWMNAQNLFFRNYNPANIDFDGNSIKAIFAGWDITINNKMTYKWYILNEAKIDKKYYTEEFADYISVKDE